MDKLNWKDFKYFINSWVFFTFNRNKDVLQDINNATSKNIENACEYAINNAGYVIQFLPNKLAGLQDKTLLEIGAGQDFGIALLLADLGLKQVIIVDPFLVEWDNQYHPEFYSTLLKKAQEKYPNIHFESLENVIQNNAHETIKLRCHKAGLEHLTQVENNTVDISISNAVFEHFVQPKLALKELSRITKKDGLGFHQIDLRDHRDFEKPLEFLTFPEKMFQKLLKITNACFGNRLRYSEYNQLFEKCSFEVEFKADNKADDTYLQSIRQRAIKKYQTMTDEEIGTLGGRFFIRKK